MQRVNVEDQFAYAQRFFFHFYFYMTPLFRRDFVKLRDFWQRFPTLLRRARHDGRHRGSHGLALVAGSARHG